MSRITRVLPAPAESRELDDARGWLSELYRLERPAVRLNFVASLNGSVVGEDGTSETLSGSADRRILGVLRAESDVVLVGAETVRTERYRPPSSTRIAIVTRSGDLGDGRVLDGDRPVVLGPADALEAAGRRYGGRSFDAVPLLGEALDPREIVARLAERRLLRIVCEGGPRLAAALLDAECVDELCLTTAPRLYAPGIPLLPALAAPHDARLAHLLATDDGYLYSRWALSSSVSTSAG